MFREGRENDARSGRPATSRGDVTVASVRELLNVDRIMRVALPGDTVNIEIDEWQMRKVCAKFVPKVLTDDQKNKRVAVCEELVRCCEGDPRFLDNVMRHGSLNMTLQRKGRTPNGTRRSHLAQKRQE